VTAVTSVGEGLAERREVVALASELGRRELAPHALELDERRPDALESAWGRVAEVGFDRALLPVEDGGVGLDAGSLLLCLEEIGAGDAGVALLVLLSNAALAALAPERAAAIAGDERWALVPAPPERLATPARLSASGGDGLELTGALSPAFGALGASGVVVIRRDAEPGVHVLPAGTPGLQIDACDPPLGLRSAAPARISLSAAVAEPATSAGEAPATLDSSLALLRAGGAAIARGIARRAHEMALEYAENRRQGGVPIIEHDAVREMLAAMKVRESAAPAPLGAEIDPSAALADRVAATDAALATATDAVQVFGGTGYMHETGVEKLMRDAKSLQLWPEPAWIAHDMIAEALVG
jgi:alkylation response protein AidB-like acyl-CoA dehydrogenase